MELKKCPVCGADNSSLAKFCYACGADLRDEAERDAGRPPQETNGAQTPSDAGEPYRQTGGYQMPPQGPYGHQAPYQPYRMPPQGNDYGQPYQSYSAAPFVPLGYRQKSKIAAGVLGILLGTFGVHNFYLGYTGKAVAQLLITLLTCFTGAFISMIWGIVEGAMILCGGINTDGNNVPLSD